MGEQIMVDLQAPQGRTAIVQILPPEYRAYRLAATAHRWVASDIVQYVVELKQRTSTGPDVYGALSPAVSVTVPLKGGAPKTTAAFANLRQGAYYGAFVTAWGNAGGIVANPVASMNASPGAAYFDFTTYQDVSTALTATALISFDAVDFNGTGTLSFSSPADGVFRAPSASPGLTLTP